MDTFGSNYWMPNEDKPCFLIEAHLFIAIIRHLEALLVLDLSGITEFSLFNRRSI